MLDTLRPPDTSLVRLRPHERFTGEVIPVVDEKHAWNSLAVADPGDVDAGGIVRRRREDDGVRPERPDRLLKVWIYRQSLHHSATIERKQKLTARDAELHTFLE